MNSKELELFLKSYKRGELELEDVMDRLKSLEVEDINFAHLDHHRHLRQGFPEVVFCQGKEDEESLEILLRLAEREDNILATRAGHSLFERLQEKLPEAEYYPRSRVITIHRDQGEAQGQVLILSGGTSDLPVAEEAALTAEIMGSRVNSIHDVGVAGIHRLFRYQEQLQQALVIVVVAGMEGALPSVVGGLVRAPVIAVPTSVGYGAHFQGLAPLLSMLNSCAPGVGTVNIDNGFGAGYLAHLINTTGSRE